MGAKPAKPVTRGGKALRAFLNVRGLSVPVFCEEYGLERIQVQKAMNGHLQKVSVDLAAKIEKATDGAVPWHVWKRTTPKRGAVLETETGSEPLLTAKAG